jgi:hypothetical protein
MLSYSTQVNEPLMYWLQLLVGKSASVHFIIWLKQLICDCFRLVGHGIGLVLLYSDVDTYHIIRMNWRARFDETGTSTMTGDT